METGTIKWFDPEKGFGFISPDNGGADIFVHFSRIETGDYKNLQPAQRVSFVVEYSAIGMQASRVQVL